MILISIVSNHQKSLLQCLIYPQTDFQLMENRHGDLTFIRHNELRDLTAGWLQEVCYNVAVEPPLLPLNGETITPVSAIRNDEARADVRATGFWGRRQGAFFDIRVFHPNAPSYPA